MGYRSQWKLAVQGPSDAVKVFQEWLKEQHAAASDKYDGVYTPKSTWESIIESLESETTLDGGMTLTRLVFGHDYTKCYDPWERIISEILCHVREQEGMDAAYARIGEEPDDVELNNGDELFIPYSFTLHDPY